MILALGVIALLGPVNTEAADRVIARAEEAASRRVPLTLVLDSPGGQVAEGLRISNRLSELRREGLVVHCEVWQFAGSMAAWLLESPACTDRTIGQGAALTFHRPLATPPPEQNAEELREIANLLDVVSGIFCAWVSLASGGKVPGTECLVKLNADRDGTWVVSAQEAYERGLTDKLFGL